MLPTVYTRAAAVTMTHIDVCMCTAHWRGLTTHTCVGIAIGILNKVCCLWFIYHTVRVLPKTDMLRKHDTITPGLSLSLFLLVCRGDQANQQVEWNALQPGRPGVVWGETLPLLAHAELPIQILVCPLEPMYSLDKYSLIKAFLSMWNPWQQRRSHVLKAVSPNPMW